MEIPSCISDAYTLDKVLINKTNIRNYIINELNKIKKDKTIIVISHNISALSACDVIYEIKNKKIELKK